MIPIRDDVPTRRPPVVTIAIIAICAVAFLIQLATRTGGQDTMVERFGMIPARVLHPGTPVMVREAVRVQTVLGPRVVERTRPLAEPSFPPWITMLTCIFLHGSWLHFLGNVWFLWIFGDNVEDRMGRATYLAFYLAAGVGASLFHLLTNAGSTMPTIGASGAIAGVMGAYFLLYPRAQVLVLVPILLFFPLIVLPASLFLGLWFVLQLFQGAVSVTATASTGIAWWAHIGGFLVGVGVTAWLRERGRLLAEPARIALRPRPIERRPPPSPGW